MREKIIQDLSDTMDLTLPYFDEGPELLERSYAPGKWTLRKILVHLSDTETILLNHLRHLATVDDPCVLSLDAERWSKVLFYEHRDLLLAKAQYECSRRSVIELARELDGSCDGRSGSVYAEAGRTSIGSTLPHVSEHNAHHLEQIRALAESRIWMPRA